MKLSTSSSRIDERLEFRAASDESVAATATQLRLLGEPGALAGCRLTIEVSAETYRRIERDKLFHLDPTLWFWTEGDAIEAEPAVEITLALQPDRVALLENDLVIDAASAARYLASLAGDPPAEPTEPALLAADSWLCLSVSQRQAGRQVGYHTFWSYLDPERFHTSRQSGALLATALVDFVADWTKATAIPRDGDAVDRMVDAISEFLDDLMATPGASPDRRGDPAVARGDTRSGAPSLVPGKSLHEIALGFFRDDRWPVAEIAGSSAATTSFRGDSGQWACLVQTREDESQLLFYSLCPVTVHRDQYGAAAEVIARANAGMILGNFELDYDDGEIRFKSSIDVEGDRLTPALVRQLVYANVHTTDQYLPAIRAVLEDGDSPALAIARVEAASPPR